MASTQDALYRRIDLDLSWSERDLPERERTKHVNRLHPYLGKFIPQLVEALLLRHLPAGRVLDPFAGSGTTLVQALESGYDATGADVAPFNCLLMRVKTREYNPFVLESELRDALARLDAFEGSRPAGRFAVHARLVRAPGRGGAALLPLARRGLRARRPAAGRARAGGAVGQADDPFRPRLPAEPQKTPYWCHKHRRECKPVGEARRFLRRYALDTLARVKEFARVRARGREALVLHGDARELDFGPASPGSSPRRRTRA